jgi:uncharacterized protein YodC (DUF2158 family)
MTAAVTELPNHFKCYWFSGYEIQAHNIHADALQIAD